LSQGPWPDGCEGAVSLTFDDAMSSQLDLAVPILREAGLCGTFYVNPRGDDWAERLAPWRAVQGAGHEIGNHTVNHVCSRNFSFVGDRNLESLGLPELEWEIAEGKRRLSELFPEQGETSFCYPCYQDSVGEGATRQSYVPLVARHHPTARSRGEVPNHPFRCDLHLLSSYNAERMSGAELVGLAERAGTQCRWTIFTFHGIQQGGLSVSETDFRELVAHLARHRARLWTAPVIEVVRRIRAAR
jgi:hypothetical protein